MAVRWVVTRWTGWSTHLSLKLTDDLHLNTQLSHATFTGQVNLIQMSTSAAFTLHVQQIDRVNHGQYTSC